MSAANTDMDRRLRLWAVDCAARVLPIYEATETSRAPREAIIAARRYARGEISADAMAAAHQAIIDAVRGMPWASARSAATAAVWAVKNARIADGPPPSSAGESAWAAIVAVGGDDATQFEESRWQLDRLLLWLSDPEPDDWPLPPEARA